MSGISIHVVDVVRGMPARGMRVEVFRVEASQRLKIASGTVGADGAVAHPIAAGTDVVAGVHEVQLATGSYYRDGSADVGEPAFQEVTLFRFTVVDPREHYHLPIKLSPWGLSIWRGR
ncbi:MAG TPA: hydroxyisourate hydrolase [Casimicrobiaceae bacterium]|nr:hydroxyisourate hydrolase [Casimicrobiaceae bacterium]